jgi:hypothetical protein
MSVNKPLKTKIWLCNSNSTDSKRLQKSDSIAVVLVVYQFELEWVEWVGG